MTTDDEEVERAVFMDGEDALSLLSDGETTAKIVEPDGGGDLERHRIEVVNTAGRHPGYTTQPETRSSQPKWKRLARHAATPTIVISLTIAATHILQGVGITVNGQQMAFSETNAIVTAVFVMVIAGLMIYATTIVPRMGMMGRYNR